LPTSGCEELQSVAMYCYSARCSYDFLYEKGLLIRGDGDDCNKADKIPAEYLQTVLGKDHALIYPKLTANEAAPDFGWIKQVENEIDKTGDDVIVIAHSLGASLLLKYLSESNITKR